MNSFLAKTLIFKDLDDRALQSIEQNAHRQKVDSGHAFVRQGEPALFFYILVQGYAKITQVTPDGHQVLLRYIGPGQEFGLVAVLSGFDFPTSVQAVEECEVLYWEGELLAQLIERYPRIAFNAMRVLALQNQASQHRYQELLTERVEQRLAQAILRLGTEVGRNTADGTLIEGPLSRARIWRKSSARICIPSAGIMSRREQGGLVQTSHKSVVLLRSEEFGRSCHPKP